MLTFKLTEKLKADLKIGFLFFCEILFCCSIVQEHDLGYCTRNGLGTAAKLRAENTCV